MQPLPRMFIMRSTSCRPCARDGLRLTAFVGACIANDRGCDRPGCICWSSVDQPWVGAGPEVHWLYNGQLSCAPIFPSHSNPGTDSSPHGRPFYPGVSSVPSVRASCLFWAAILVRLEGAFDIRVLPERAWQSQFAFPTHQPHCAHAVESVSASRLEAKNHSAIRWPYGCIFLRPHTDGIIRKDSAGNRGRGWSRTGCRIRCSAPSRSRRTRSRASPNTRSRP